MACIGLFAQNQRERINFDADWQFAFGDASSPAKDFGCGTEYFNYLTKAASIHNEGPYVDKFDASSWKSVDLPHDWVVDLPFEGRASHSHGYKTVGHKYPQTSVGWYRKTFTIPAEDYGKHIWLQFDGIFRDARIWVNGFYLGHEPSGYATQTYDISEYLNYGGENLVCVRADATLEEGWFYEGAGIYRHVWLNKAAKVNVAPSGTFAYCEFAAPYVLRGDAGPDLRSASLHIETTVQNMGASTAVYTLKHRLVDASGKEVGSYAELDKAVQYVVYRFDKGEKVNLNDPSKIVTITRENYIILPYDEGKVKYQYVVTALDRLHNESKAVKKQVKL